MAVCNGGSRVSSIMARAVITHHQATAYAEQLIARGLLKHDALERKYFTTPEGIRYLGMMELIAEILPIGSK